MNINYTEVDHKTDNFNLTNVNINKEKNNCLKGYEWCNELLSFPQLFNQIFLSLYKYNEYIDQRWSILTECHKKLFNLLIEISKYETEYNQEFTNNIVILERFIQNNSIYRPKIINKSLEHNIKIEISNNEYFNNNNLNLNNKHDFKKQTYNDLFNKYLTCKNDIDITFERKTEMTTELYSRLKKIISSIELFISNNPDLLESQIKPLYNINNHEIVDIGVVKKKSGIRGRPPGTSNRGRPIGSTKKTKKDV